MLAEPTAGADLPLPETVQGIIAARLDTLAPEEKALVQDAAVVGKVFWVGALGAVSGRPRAEVEEGLLRLERKEFVRRERRSSVGGRDRLRLPARARPRRRLLADPARRAGRRRTGSPPSGSRAWPATAPRISPT